MTDEEHKARIRHHMYETCEGIEQHAERIVALEELAFDALTVILGWTMALNEHAGCEALDATTLPAKTFAELQARARELGIPDV